MRAFIQGHFDGRVLAAYDDLIPLSFKSDLGRFCLLYVFGGVYSDVANHFFSGVCDETPEQLHVFRDCHNRAPWIVATGLVAAPPRMPVFEKCIETICEHVAQHYHGTNPLCVTGPNLLGAQLAASTPVEQIRNGVVVHVNQGYEAFPAIAFVSPQGDLIAIRNKTSAGIKSLGVNVEHSYEHLYEEGEVYRSEQRKPRVFAAHDFRRRGLLTNARPADGEEGVLVSNVKGVAIYGPYCRLRPGRYRAEFCLSGGPGCSSELHGDHDVVCNVASTVISPRREFLLKLTPSHTPLPIEFRVSETAEQCEVRLFSHSPATFIFHHLKVSHLD